MPSPPGPQRTLGNMREKLGADGGIGGVSPAPPGTAAVALVAPIRPVGRGPFSLLRWGARSESGRARDAPPVTSDIAPKTDVAHTRQNRRE